MSWIRWVGLTVVVLISFGVYRMVSGVTLPQTPEEVAAVRAKASTQNEDAYYRPARNPLEPQSANSLKNVYFGDLHIHTEQSADAYLFGNRIDMDTAYEFAKSKSIELVTGERVELTRPLDFAALTDHAEGFGRNFSCANPDLEKAGRKACESRESQSLIAFMKMRLAAQKRPPVKDLTMSGEV